MKPECETPDLGCGKERCAVLGVLCGDATPLFEHQGAIFDQVVQFVKIFISTPFGFFGLPRMG